MQKKVRCFGIIGVLAMAGCGSSFSARRVAPNEETARALGARIAVRTVGRLSPNLVSAGDRIEVELAEPMAIDGLPRLAESVKAVLHVVDVNAGMRDPNRARLSLRLTQLRPSLSRFVEVHTRPLEFRGGRANLQAGTTLAFELVSTVPEAAVVRRGGSDPDIEPRRDPR